MALRGVNGELVFIHELAALEKTERVTAFRDKMEPRLRKASNPKEYLDLAEEFRCFNNKVRVVTVFGV